jgi:hypothetical protein
MARPRSAAAHISFAGTPSSGSDRWPDQLEPLENHTDIVGERQAHRLALTVEEARVCVQPPGPRPVTLAFAPREAVVNRPERADSHVRRAHDRQRPAIAAEHEAPVARSGQRLVLRHERLHELRRRSLGTVQHQEAELVGQLRGVAEREGRHERSVVAAVRDIRRPHRVDCPLVGGGDVHGRHPRQCCRGDPDQGPQELPHMPPIGQPLGRRSAEWHPLATESGLPSACGLG